MLSRLSAVWISGTWLNACGMLPTCLPVPGVVLLAEQSDVVAQRQQPVEQLGGVIVRPIMCSAFASQKLQARKAPSCRAARPTCRPADRRAAGTGGRSPPVISSRWMASHGGRHPRIVGGRKPTSGMSSTAASSSVGAVVLGERPAVGVVALVADLLVDLVADLLPAGRPGRADPGRSRRPPPGQRPPRPSPWSARSAAAGRGPPRSPRPARPSASPGSRAARAAATRRAGRSPTPSWRPSVQRVDDLAVHVQLALGRRLRCRSAPARRRRSRAASPLPTPAAGAHPPPRT